MLGYCELRNQFQGESNIVFRGRIIWRDIATWIRAYLVYVYLESDPELQQLVVDKLMSVPDEFSDMLRLFFGDKAAEDYNTMLTNYIALLINLINAQKNGDAAAVDEYIKQLYQNVDERAELLSKINPFWEKTKLQNLIYTFTQMTIEEINTFLTKDFKRNLQIFDRILNHTSVMGDYIAEGIENYLQYGIRK